MYVLDAQNICLSEKVLLNTQNIPKFSLGVLMLIPKETYMCSAYDFPGEGVRVLGRVKLFLGGPYAYSYRNL